MEADRLHPKARRENLNLVALHFTLYSGLAEFGKGLLWEANAQMSQLARPRSNTVPLTADHRLFLRVLG